MTFDTEYQNTAICPYCGHEHQDMWEVDFGPGLDGDTEMSCDDCERTFLVSRIVDVRYSSFKTKQ